jgi:hypothetical protein
MRLPRLFAVAALFAALFALVPPDRARAVDDGEVAGIRQTIEGQLNAFRRDDAAGAYGFAAPSIQQIFPSQDAFMQMVRQGYAPIYRPRSFSFEAPREIGGTIGQEVRVVDEDGGNWLALYTMEKQPDGSWKISGCRLVKAPDQSV